MSTLDAINQRLKAYLEDPTTAIDLIDITEDGSESEAELSALLQQLLGRHDQEMGEYDNYRDQISGDLEHIYEAVSRMSSGDFDVIVQIETPQLAPLGDAFSFLCTSLKTLTEHQARRRRELSRQVEEVQQVS